MYRYLAVISALALFVILDLIIPNGYVNAQVNQNGQNTLFAPNNITNAGTTANGTGIMKNTSGMLDEAFDALRNTFGPFFGK